MKKVLIIRFSSFGDIVQCLPVIDYLTTENQYEVDWLTKAQFKDLVLLHSRINRVYTIGKNTSLLDYLRLCWELSKIDYDLVYDAHQNIRSKLLLLLFRLRNKTIVIRPKERFKRFLLFILRINMFEKPFRGMLSYLKPLQKILQKQFRFTTDSYKFDENFEHLLKSKLKVEVSEYIILVPSAAWEMKRWPVGHWKQLVTTLKGDKFIILGGPEDFFCEEIQKIAPDRMLNFAGKLSLLESVYVISKAKVIISADTGLLHVADLFAKNGIGLIGPTAFGHTTGETIRILEKNLSCKPCSKDGSGRCSNDLYQRCMVEITVEDVIQALSSNNFL